MNFISAFEVIGPKAFQRKSDRGDIHSVWFFCKNV